MVFTIKVFFSLSLGVGLQCPGLSQGAKVFCSFGSTGWSASLGHLFIRGHDRLRGAGIAFAARLHQPAGCPDVRCQFYIGPCAGRAQWGASGILGKHPISPLFPLKIVPHAHVVLICLIPFSLRLSPCEHLVQFSGCTSHACCVSVRF